MRYPVVVSRKELESVVFVEEEFLHKKIQRKEDVFEDLTTKRMRGKYLMWNSMDVEACEDYKMTEMFEKVCS